MNTAAGGTGDAIIGQGIIGSNSGGRITVASNAGNILWSNDPAYTAFNASHTGLSSGGGNSQTLRANAYNLTTTATNGSVGTDARPLQFDNFGSDEMAHTEANLTVSTGTGGIYVTAWGVAGNDLTTGTITAQGAGNIRIATANSAGHNLWVAGPITTGSGTISLYADDEFTMTPSGLVGGAGFSGLVDIIGNRDAGNGQSANMQAGSAIVTSNATADAVRLISLSAGNNASTGLSDLTPQGGVVLGNITVGDGGTITVNAAGGAVATRQGSIVQRADTLVDAGPNGTVVLLARANDTTATTNPLNTGNIGANGDIVNLTQLPVKVRAGTVTATTNGTNLNNTGVINVINTIGGTFNATTTGNATAFVTLTTEAGALTIGGPTSTGGGAMTLTGAGGVVLNAPVGNGTSGAIGITGPLERHREYRPRNRRPDSHSGCELHLRWGHQWQSGRHQGRDGHADACRGQHLHGRHHGFGRRTSRRQYDRLRDGNWGSDRRRHDDDRWFRRDDGSSDRQWHVVAGQWKWNRPARDRARRVCRGRGARPGP